MSDPTGGARMAALAMLGLSEPASAQEITRAYRTMAKATHPDVTGPLDDDAAGRFVALTAAYHLLRADPPAMPTPVRPTPPRRPQPIPIRLASPIRLANPMSRPPIVAGPPRITPLPRRRVRPT